MMITISFAAIGQEAKMASVVEGGNRFALDLYGKLKGQPGNLFFSPSSISTALAMTYAGARGETAEQMARVLHFPAPRTTSTRRSPPMQETLRQQAQRPGCRLNLANRLWGQQGYHFLPDFLAITRDQYHAELAQVDFVGNAEQARDADQPVGRGADPAEDQGPGSRRRAHAADSPGADQRHLLPRDLDETVRGGA